MGPKIEEKILRKLDRIEKILAQIVPRKKMPQKTELTEEEFLEIAKESNREYRDGKTENLETFLKREYPQYVKKNRALHQV